MKDCGSQFTAEVMKDVSKYIITSALNDNAVQSYM